MARLGRTAFTVSAILLFWWLLASQGGVNPLFLPHPGRVASALYQLLLKSNLYRDVLATSWRALAGVVLSACLGIPLGILLGRVPTLYEYLELPIDFFRSVPSSALFFLFILLFGIGDEAKIAVVFYGCSLILVVSTAYGARDTREKIARREVLRVVGASRWQQFCWATFPDAIPHISAGVRVCVSLSLVLVVVTEMFLASDDGLGRRIYDFYLTYRVPEMYAVILILGFLGFTLNQALVAWERRTAVWAASSS